MAVGVFVRIKDDGLWARFKEYVIHKHGKLHSALGEELCEAIRLYLKEAGGTHTFPNRGVKTSKEIEKIKREILKIAEPGGAVPKEMLSNIIRKASGVVDKRAVRNRLETLVASGFLKRDWSISINGNIFRVMGDAADKPT